MGLLDLNTYVPEAQNMTEEQRDAVRKMGFLQAASSFANMGNPSVGSTGYSPMQMITGGFNAFGQGANEYAKMLQDQYKADRERAQQEQWDSYLQGMTPEQRTEMGLPEGMPATQDMVGAMAQNNAKLRLEDFYKQKQNASDPTSRGGATGALVDRAMNDPEFRKALYDYQTGWRQGLTTDEEGSVAPMSGVAGAKGDIKYGEEAGKQKAQLEYAGKKEEEKKVGASQGEVKALLLSMESKMPELEQTVKKLSDLGQKATYTMAGIVTDTSMRELGLPVSEGAEARAEYNATVDNQILPLLRDTFGAQFTEREGQALRATLGNANLSPSEKDAVLNSFIEQKKMTIESLARQTGKKSDATGSWGIKRKK